MKLTQYIPLWIKTPLMVLLTEVGKWPLSLVWAHTQRSFAEHIGYEYDKKEKAWTAVQAVTLDYLNKRYGHLAQITDLKLGVPVENAPVWVFWWQGEENAPVLVQRCIASIRKYAGNHPVRVIDQENYREFVTIPAHIEVKREQGIISLTHFSDILRMALLAEYGGLWLDSTIYATDSLESAFRGGLFTVRNPGLEHANVSRWDWSGFAIGGHKGCDLFRLAGDIFSAYWQTHNQLVDYFLIDYTLRLIVDSNAIFQEALSAIEPNNKGIYHYQMHFNDPADLLPPEDTWLFKLSWKGNYNTATEDGKETLYGRWLRETEEML